MRTGPPAPGDRQRGNCHPGPAASWPATDSLDARRARLAAFWALVLRRFRDYAHRISGPEQQGEEDR
jgi:hypothetical protein